jgi:hypothetical protein
LSALMSVMSLSRAVTIMGGFLGTGLLSFASLRAAFGRLSPFGRLTGFGKD